MTCILKGEGFGRKGRVERTERGYVFSFARIYRVISSVRDEHESTVLSTSGVPVVGFTTIDGCVCSSLDPSQDSKAPNVWTVTAEFSNAPTGQQTGDDPDPTTWTPIYKGRIETYPEAFGADWDNRPYVNSAGCKHTEPIVVSRPVIVYEGVQYEDSALTDLAIGDRNDCVNAGAWGTGAGAFPAKTLKVNIPEFERFLLWLRMRSHCVPDFIQPSQLARQAIEHGL